MEWSCWSSILFLFLSLSFATSNGDFSSGAIQAVRCMLAQAVPRDCTKLPEVPVPSYLVQVYDDSPSSLHEALRSGQLDRLSNAQIAKLPLSLLYLIPRGRLTDLNGTQLGIIIQQHAQDKSLAQQVAVSLQHRRHILQLLHKLKVAPLSQDVLLVVGEAINLSDLNDAFLNSLPFFKEPILAYLRPTILLKLDVTALFKVLFHLKELELSNLPRKQTIYAIAQAALRHKFPLAKINWLVTGLSPDEIRNDNLLLDLNIKSFRLDLNVMQARAVFERVYHNVTLHQSHFIDCQPLLFKLSPALLQKFSAREHKYDTLAKLPSPLSLPTAYQIREYVKADCTLTGKLPRGEEEWGARIRYLGPWVYTLPLAALQEYLEDPLSTASLQEIESPALSPLQAYYLTGRGKSMDVVAPNSVLGLDTLLHALPASQLVSHKVGEISSSVLEHLVANLPADNLPRTLSLVHKIASSIGEPFILENLLDNSDVNIIMSLMSPKDIQASGFRMLKMFKANHEYWPIVQQLPQEVLAALLEQAQQSSNWSWHSLLDISQVSHLLTGGLTCRHIEDMDTGLFIPILAQYNRNRKHPFPKNLQHCCLRKLISHLQLKMTLTQSDPSYGLISMLEPVEIESVGGYVLVGLPVEAMKESPYLGHILAAIGRLSNAELMLAADTTHMQAIAQMVIDKEGSVNVFIAGNLIWFLPHIHIPELRLMLESGLLDTTLCLSAESRHLLAVNLVTDFGPPKIWSAGVLSTLQDLLLVFTNDELLTIKEASWTDAADCFISHYSDEIHWIEPTPFYQVCASILGKSEEVEYRTAVSNLVRWHLRAAQWQLDTVQHLSHVSSLKPAVNYRYVNLERQPEISIRIFNPQVEEESTSTLVPSTEVTKSPTTEDSTNEYIKTSTEKSTTSTEESTTSTEKSITSTEKSTTSTEKSITSTEKSTTSTEKSITNTEESATSTSKGSTTTEERDSITEGKTAEEKIFYAEEAKDISKTNSTSVESTPSSTIRSTTSTNEKTHISTYNESIATKETDYNAESKTMEYTITNSTAEVSQSEGAFTASSTEKSSATTPLQPSSSSENTSKDAQSVQNDWTTPLTENSTLEIPSSTDEEKRYINEKEDQGNNSAEGNEMESSPEPGAPERNDTPVTEEVNNENSNMKIKPIAAQTSNNESVSTWTNTTAKMPQTTNKTTNASEAYSLPENRTENETNAAFPSELQQQVKNISQQNVSETDLETINSSSTPNPEGIKTGINSSTPMSTRFDKNTTSTEQLMIDSTPPTVRDDSTDLRASYTNFNSESDDTYEKKDDNEDPGVNSILEDSDTASSSNGRKKRNSVESEYNNVLTCNALRMVGKQAALALSESDLMDMSNTELDDCRVEFGAMNLSLQLQKQIWRRIKKQDGIHLLGNLLRVAAVGDLWDLEYDISRPWALETIHAFIKNVNNTVVLEKLLKEVQSSNADFPPELLAVLGGSLCALETINLHALSAVGLEPWAQCPACLPHLAQKALEQLGPVSEWAQHHVHVLHGIVAGLELEDWKKLIELPSRPLTALRPLAVKCLNYSHLEILSPDQIKMIPTLTLQAMSQQQITSLNESQLSALRNATELSVPEKLTSSRIILVSGVPSRGSYNVEAPLYCIVIMSLLAASRIIFGVDIMFTL